MGPSKESLQSFVITFITAFSLCGQPGKYLMDASHLHLQWQKKSRLHLRSTMEVQLFE
jgi:hypothetical protein